MSTRTPDTSQAAAGNATAGAEQSGAPEAAAEVVVTGPGELPATELAGSESADSASAGSESADSESFDSEGTDSEGTAPAGPDTDDVGEPGGPDGALPGPVAVDFPVYGLHPGIPGPRWVDFFEGGNGRPAEPDAGAVSDLGETEHSPWALWLGQRLADTERGLRVGSMPRLRYERAMCPGGGDPLAEVAFGAAFGLVNLTLPDSSVPRPHGLIESLLAHAEQHARRYEKWEHVTWWVDGMSVRARIWEFAGGWTGFTGDLDDSYVAVIGIGVAPDGLSLARVTDPKSYGVDFSAPISLLDLGRHRATRPEAWLPPPRRDAFHPEQTALLPEDRTTEDI